MTIRRTHKDGLHLIECAICGEIKWNNQIKLGARSMLPMCLYHADENYESLEQVSHPPLQTVPQPSNKPADKFKTFSTPDE